MILQEQHSLYHKTPSALIKFVRHWSTLTPEQLKQAIPDAKSLEEAQSKVASLNLKDSNTQDEFLENALKSNDHSYSVEHVHEYIKGRQTLFSETEGDRFLTLALTALEKDSKKQGKVYLVANTLRRLQKAAVAGVQTYQELA